MKTIWAYELGKMNGQALEIPKGAEVLTIQMQGERLCLWAMVDPGEEKVTRHFEVYGTGHEISNDSIHRMYIGTFQLMGGSLIFHVFEKLGS